MNVLPLTAREVVLIELLRSVSSEFGLPADKLIEEVTKNAATAVDATRAQRDAKTNADPLVWRRVGARVADLLQQAAPDVAQAALAELLRRRSA